MQTIDEIRRSNLERLIKEIGTQDRVAEFGGTSSVYLSQIRNSSKDGKTGKPRVMGDEMARRLETGCQKPRGWMDNFQTEELKAFEELRKSYSPYVADVLSVQEPQAEYNVTPITTYSRVPVISWVQAGGFCDAADPYPAGIADASKFILLFFRKKLSVTLDT